MIDENRIGSCTNSGLVCHRSSETGELWCARLREWLGSCPKDEDEERVNAEWYEEEIGE